MFSFVYRGRQSPDYPTPEMAATAAEMVSGQTVRPVYDGRQFVGYHTATGSVEPSAMPFTYGSDDYGFDIDDDGDSE